MAPARRRQRNAAAGASSQSQGDATKIRRNSRPVLGNASNRRQTRSQTAKLKHQAADVAEAQPVHPAGQRRSLRMSNVPNNNHRQPMNGVGAQNGDPAAASISGRPNRTSKPGRPRVDEDILGRLPPEVRTSVPKPARKSSQDDRQSATSTSDSSNGGIENNPNDRRRSRSTGRSRDPQKKRSRSDRHDADTCEDRIPAKKRKAQSRSRDKQAASTIPQEDNHDMALADFDPSTFTRSISAFDIANSSDVLETPEYVTDIFHRLFEAETRTLIPRYMELQSDLTANMRCILVDWLVDVHKKLRLLPDTLYLTVSIFDRYLGKVETKRKKLQLVASAAALISSKYEEIYAPEVRDLVYMTDQAYAPQDFLDMEADILRELDFKITVPTALPFLQRFLFITGASPTTKFAAAYYTERVLLEYDFVDRRPSIVAAAAVCLALNHKEIRDADGLFGDLPGIPPTILQQTGYTADEIVSVARVIGTTVSEDCRVASSGRTLGAVQRKYGTVHYGFVSVDFRPPNVSDILGPK